MLAVVCTLTRSVACPSDGQSHGGLRRGEPGTTSPILCNELTYDYRATVLYCAALPADYVVASITTSTAYPHGLLQSQPDVQPVRLNQPSFACSSSVIPIISATRTFQPSSVSVCVLLFAIFIFWRISVLSRIITITRVRVFHLCIRVPCLESPEPRNITTCCYEC